jgi:ribonuclease HI
MLDLSNGIAVDAAHSQKNKRTEIQGVDLTTGKTIFYQDLGNQTINIGEFLAIVEGVKYIIANNYKPRVIFSDSVTGITWFKNKKSASGKRNKMLQKAEAYLRIASFWVDKIQVIKWDNRKYGEIPADFGNK